MFALSAFPVFTQRGLRDIPIGARLARHLAQIMPEVIRALSRYYVWKYNDDVTPMDVAAR
ncbi:MAG: hypothetical protein WCD86_26730 [Ktedonobacteraceae bacterium]